LGEVGKVRAMVAGLVRTVRRQSPERLALVFGLFAGVLSAAFAVSLLQSGQELDFQAYYFTGKAIVEGKPFVGTAIHEGTFLTDKEYVYTPITGPVFAVYALFPKWYLGYVVHGLVLLATFYALGRISIRYIESHGRDLAKADRWLILLFFMFSGPSVLGLFRGNVDPIMLWMVVVGYLAVERGREAYGGTLWAIASLFKFFPAMLGVWLLYRRAYRAIAAALAVGIGAVVLSVAVFGLETHIEFVDFILHERSRQAAFEGGLDPSHRAITLRRPLSRILPLSGLQLAGLSLALLSPFLALLYWHAETDLENLGVFFATLITLLITVIPSTMGYSVYFLFPLVPLVYLVENRTAKDCLLAGLVLIHVIVYPQDIQLLFEALPLSEGTVETIMAPVWGVLAYGSFQLWGTLSLFAGCLVYVCLPLTGVSADRPGINRT